MEDAIKGLVPHILSFVINELCKNSFLIAYEKDLADLKGLIDADSISSHDYELLEAVNDPAVKFLLNSVDKVMDCSRTYLLINNLDEMEVMFNEEYNQLASDNYYCYIIDWEIKTYEDLIVNLNTVYFSISQMLYHTACQLELNVIEVPDETYEEFIDKYPEILDGKLEPANKNAVLLYDLITELNRDLMGIDSLGQS